MGFQTTESEQDYKNRSAQLTERMKNAGRANENHAMRNELLQQIFVKEVYFKEEKFST